MTVQRVGLALLRGLAFLAVGLGAGLSLAIANAPALEWLSDGFTDAGAFLDLLRPHWAWIALVGFGLSLFRTTFVRWIGGIAMVVGTFLTIYALVSFANGANTI